MFNVMLHEKKIRCHKDNRRIDPSNLFFKPAIVTDPSTSASTTVGSLKAMYNGCMDTETIEVIIVIVIIDFRCKGIFSHLIASSFKLVSNLSD